MSKYLKRKKFDYLIYPITFFKLSEPRIENEEIYEYILNYIKPLTKKQEGILLGQIKSLINRYDNRFIKYSFNIHKHSIRNKSMIIVMKNIEEDSHRVIQNIQAMESMANDEVNINPFGDVWERTIKKFKTTVEIKINTQI